jgi:hypothetical protein
MIEDGSRTVKENWWRYIITAGLDDENHNHAIDEINYIKNYIPQNKVENM